MKVFISWSGERSKIIAQAWKHLLTYVLQHCTPFMSESGIQPGNKWFSVLATELRDTDFGIICLTPENKNARWILFEAGAVSKHLEVAQVCPYHFDMETSEVEFPLQGFNASMADKAGTYGIVTTINKQIQTRQLSESELENAFEKWWPDFEKRLVEARKTEIPKPDRRTDVSMLHELVDLARANAKATSRSNQLLERTLFETPEDMVYKSSEFDEVHVYFEGGPRNGDSIQGPPTMNAADSNDAGRLFWITQGEVGGIWNAPSDLSMSLMFNLDGAAHSRLMKEDPDAYGRHAYQIRERKVDGRILKLKLEFVPPAKYKEANALHKKMEDERAAKKKKQK